MNKRDQQFFDEHYKEWIKRNPPPDSWFCDGTEKQWAEFEMPCLGFFGRILFGIDKWLSRKK